MKRIIVATIFFCLLATIAMTMIVACQPDGPSRHAYPNPAFDALRKKGVKYRLAQRGSDYAADTLFVTEHGIYDDKKGFMYHECTFYDSLNFIRKDYWVSDLKKRSIVRHHFRDTLHFVQEWVEAEERYWKINDASVTVDAVTKLLVFDDGGRLVREIDSAQNIYALFTYNDAGLLKTRTLRGKEENSWTVRYLYDYDPEGDLTKIVEVNRDGATLTYYYLHGLLESHYNSRGEIMCRYQHIYY